MTTKTELINQIAVLTGSSKTDAGKFLNATIDALMSALTEGNEVKLVGFGTFKVSEVKAKEVTNPRTKEKMSVGPYRRIRFIPGRSLKDSVKGIKAKK